MSFASDVAASWAGASRLGMQDALLARLTPGTRTNGATGTGTNPTSTIHTCKAYFVSRDATLLGASITKSDDVVIGILGGSISPAAVPEANDKIVLDGKIYRVVGGDDGNGVKSDPANAVYQCHARRVFDTVVVATVGAGIGVGSAVASGESTAEAAGAADGVSDAQAVSE